MDIDLGFIASILESGEQAYRDALHEGIHSELLAGDGQTLFKFIQEFLVEYQAYPSSDLVQARTGVPLLSTGDPPGFFVQELKNRKLFLELKGGIASAVALLNDQKPAEAYGALEKLILDVRTNQLSPSRVVSLAELGGEVMEFYERIKSGAMGILFPWNKVNAATRGMNPEDLILLVAKSGVGKSWSAIQIAHHAWQNGHKVLFITTEMSQLRVATRYFAVHKKYSYSDFLNGEIGHFAEESLRDTIAHLDKKPDFKMVGGDFDFRIESMASAIDETKPELVIADGAYLLKSSGSNRIERAAHAFDSLKRLAKRSRVPIVATTQFNREAKANSTDVEMDHIALTSAASWNCDVIYALVQTDEEKSSNQMKFVPLKLREGSSEEFNVHWDYDRMCFDEVDKDGLQGIDSFVRDPADMDPDFGSSRTSKGETPF